MTQYFSSSLQTFDPTPDVTPLTGTRRSDTTKYAIN